MWQQIIEWIESHQLSCFFKKLIGLECLGCGMQRAVIALLKGNIIESIEQYPALFPIIIMLGYLGLHIVFQFEKGAKVLKHMFFFCLAIMIFSYIYKHFI